ncbi:MAG TPA: hypothetical protein VNN73_07605 [Blastocatellia bacterium]|nr:hypothetical protein [Blastocatellia bacterium]
MKHIYAFLLIAILFVAQAAAQQDCNAPALICKASANQDRSLYVRDHCRYEQRLRLERYKSKDGQDKTEEIRDTTVTVEPAAKPDKTGDTPVIVKVVADTDKKGNPKNSVNEDERTLLSVGAIWDLAFFPLLPEKIKYYNFQEVVAERKNEKWYRFVPKAEVTNVPLASGVVMLDPQTGEVLTIRIESLHNLDAIDKEAAKLRTFNATIDYSQFEGSLRFPTLASGSGVSGIRRFEGNFKFRFEEGKYRPIYKLN